MIMTLRIGERWCNRSERPIVMFIDEVDSATNDQVFLDFSGQQYIIELKIWRGERYYAEGEKQIIEFLNYWDLNTGYMLSFNFNKKKEPGVRQVHVGDKVLYEGTV